MPGKEISMSCLNCSNNKTTSALLGGAFLIGIGVLLLLMQIGVLPAHLISFWAVILIAVGLFTGLQSDGLGTRLWGGFWVVFGVLLELDYIGYARVRWDTLWPVILIAIGVLLVVRAFERPRENAGSVSPHLNLFSCMGGGEYRIRAKNFRGGTVTAVLGGFDIDLTEADIEGPEATITLNAFLGGGVIRVPQTWGVSMRGIAIMGGHSLKTREGAQIEKTLIVDGIALMGGAEIRN